MKSNRWDKLRRIFYLFEDGEELTGAIEEARLKWRVYRDKKGKILFRQEFEKHKKAYKEVKDILPTIGKKIGSERTRIDNSDITVILKKIDWDELEKIIGKPFENGKCFRCLRLRVEIRAYPRWQSSWVFPSSFQAVLKKALAKSIT